MEHGLLNPTDASDIQKWLVHKIASKLGKSEAEVRVDQYFDEFGMDSTDALVLAGEMEKWLGREVETTALWYHPTIRDLANYIAGEMKEVKR